MTHSTLNRWLGITMMIVGLIIGGIGFTNAQSPTPSTETETTTPDTSTTNPFTDTSRPARPEGDFGGGRGGRHGGKGGHSLVAATAQVTGLTEEQVRTELQAGQSPAQVAEANGKTADDVVAAAVAAEKAKLDAQVAAGTITQAEADEHLARDTERFQSQVTQAGLGGGRGGKGGHGSLISATAEVTGLTEAEIRTELEAGKSLAQVAEDNGKTADDVIEVLRTRGQERLTQELERAREELNATR